MAIANAYHAASGDDLSKLQFAEASYGESSFQVSVVLCIIMGHTIKSF